MGANPIARSTLNTIIGIVQVGQKRGRILGYPTANVPLSSSVSEGIYISTTRIKEKEYPSVTFIGASQTFGETHVQCETYILNFNLDIYGQEIGIRIIQKIRDNKKFKSADALVRQMEKDIYVAKQYFINSRSLHTSQ